MNCHSDATVGDNTAIRSSSTEAAEGNPPVLILQNLLHGPCSPSLGILGDSLGLKVLLCHQGTAAHSHLLRPHEQPLYGPASSHESSVDQHVFACRSRIGSVPKTKVSIKNHQKPLTVSGQTLSSIPSVSFTATAPQSGPSCHSRESAVLH